jgi:8-oxo-dGTP pyrophosphatase MutT (NUDIX family)
MCLADELRAYQPVNAQEATDRAYMLERLAADPLAFDRASPAHVTCSAWTVDATGTQTLLCYHKIYDSWSWIGGHADGERDLLAVARRELAEETGVANARLVAPSPTSPFASVEALAVAGHERRGQWVSAHAHLNVTYLLVADPSEPLRVNAQENSAVRCVPLDDILRVSTEPWMCEHIYRKLIARTRQLLG